MQKLTSPVKNFIYIVISVIIFSFFKIMGKLIFGLVQSGAWCCFDELNRIEVEILSMIASQIQAIKAAKDSYSFR